MKKLFQYTHILLLLVLVTSCFSESEKDSGKSKLFENHQEIDPAPEAPAPEAPAPEIVYSDIVATNFQKPVDATYAENSSLLFQIDFTSIVFVTGNISFDFVIGTQTVNAIVVSGSGTNSLEFEYTVEASDQDLDGIEANTSLNLSSGELKDSSDVALDPDISSILTSLSGIVIDSTSGITAPDKVLNLTSAPTTNNTELSLSWSAPADNGTTITHYEVQYRELGELTWETINPAPSINSSKISNLDLGVDYQIRVAANNGLIGEYSDVIQVQIFDIQSLNPVAWLDANDLNGNGVNPSDNTKVASWVDLTSTATDATEDDVANQPVFKTNVQNGLPAVRFDDHDRGLQGSFNRNIGDDFTFIIVGQFDTGSNDKAMFEFQGGANARGFFIDRRYASNTNYSPATTKNSFQIWSIEDSGTNAIVKENNTEIFNGATFFNTDFTGNGTYVLGDDTTGGNRLNGFIGEFLIFDKALSASELNQLKTYLKNKWNTP